MINPNIMSQSGYQKITASTKDVRFPSFLQGFNRRWFAGSCKAIYLCFDAQGTAKALDDAISLYGTHVRIKSGGHCYEDFVFNSGTQAIIDVTPMNGAGLVTGRGFYLGSGGTNWSAFQALFRDFGKVLPAGSCYSVGLGGHICGGGYGLLSRLNGLTVDWLTGVEVVVKDDPAKPARVVYASPDSPSQDEKDLFWAHCGGGGGNFGVITGYYFRQLPDAPVSAFITSIAWQWSGLTENTLGALLAWFATFSARTDNKRQFGLFALNHIANGEIHLTVQTAVMAGENKDVIAAAFVEPMLSEINKVAPYTLVTTRGIAHLGNLVHNLQDTLPYTFYEAVQTLNGSGANQRGKYKSAYMRKPFPPGQVKTIWKSLSTVPDGITMADMAQSLVQVDSYGGQINTKSSGATAIPQRTSIMKLQYQTYWPSDANDQGHLKWIRDFYTSMYAASGGVPDPDRDPTHNVDGCYYNYPDVDLNGPDNDKEKALRLYFGTNLPRLKKIKKRWDPRNYFNSAQSI